MTIDLVVDKLSDCYRVTRSDIVGGSLFFLSTQTLGKYLGYVRKHEPKTNISYANFEDLEEIDSIIRPKEGRHHDGVPVRRKNSEG